MRRRLSILLAALLLTGCAPPDAPAESASPPPVEQPVFAPAEIPEPDPRQECIDRLLSSMTSEEKVGQLFFPRCPIGDGAALAAEYHLGGYLLFGRDFKDIFGNWLTAEQVAEKIQSCQLSASIPMLIGVDEEGGTVTRVSSSPELRSERFASPQELYNRGGLDAVLADCREKDALLSSLGINVNFAPVADVSTSPNDFIYGRTLGRSAAETGEYIAAAVSQMKTDGMGSVLKHFPGYGPNKDTHTGSAFDSRPLDAFLECDLFPFQAGINTGNCAVLVCHNIIQALDSDRPASLSPAVYRLLREELEFDGPALTDDLAMDAVTEYAGDQCPAVLALTAGCDMVVTTDFQTQIPQVLTALEDGALSLERVTEAASRVLGWKYDLGLLQ